MVTSGNIVIPWNMPRVHLNALPVIDLDDAGNHGWLDYHAPLIIGYPAIQKRKAIAYPGEEIKSSIYTSIYSLIAKCVGFKGVPQRKQRPKAIYIRCPSDIVNGILILVIDVKLDIDANTVLLDTCVVANTEAYQLAFSSQMHAPGAYLQSDCSEEVMQAWRELLPAVTERCRTWTHDPETCEYLTTRKIPVSTQPGENPLCSCAGGTVPTQILRLKEWGLHMSGSAEALATHGTRAAISPFFHGPFSVSETDQELSKVALSGIAGAQSGKATQMTRCGLYACKKGAQDLGGKKLLTCGRCKWMKYCSAECQKADWAFHKGVCRE